MRKGFTLIELLAVVLIVSILTSISLPQYRKSVERARVAEARQMLPAIYDACDRIVVENQCSSWYACRNLLTFDKLDVSLKGKKPTTGNQNVQWETNNFTYVLIPASKMVRAEMRKGRWHNDDTGRGVFIYYNGHAFSCSASNLTGTKKQEACKMLDFTKTDQGE